MREPSRSSGGSFYLVGERYCGVAVSRLRRKGMLLSGRHHHKMKKTAMERPGWHGVRAFRVQDSTPL